MNSVCHYTNKMTCHNGKFLSSRVFYQVWNGYVNLTLKESRKDFITPEKQ